MGLAQASFLPTIAFTADPEYPFDANVPIEYQPRQVDGLQAAEVAEPAIARELELYEQDFLELADQEKVDRYARLLINLGSLRGHYEDIPRGEITEVVMGDRYEIRGQVGAVGPGAHAHDITFNQVWNEVSAEVPLEKLASELAQLRAALKDRASTPEDDLAIAEVAAAEIAAKKQEGRGPYST